MKRNRIAQLIQGMIILLWLFFYLIPAAAAESKSDMPAWIQNTNFSGDIRLRYQFEEIANAQDRHRGRLRFRYGFETKVNEKITVGFRLASGSADQLSSNQTFESAFSSKTFWLDRAYLSIVPISPLEIVGGKMKNPFFCTELLWDSDVAPEGLASTAEYSGKGPNFFLHAGAFPLAEFGNSAMDPILYGIQGGMSTNAVAKKIRAGVAYYNFSNLKGKAIEDVSPANLTKTNTLSKKGNKHLFVYDYKLLDANVELLAIDDPRAKKSLPLAFYGNYIQNMASDVKENTGWLAGFNFGTVKRSGDWQFNYCYKEVESDALPAIITNNEFHGGGTNGKGHQLKFAIGFLEKASLSITYFQTQEVTGDEKKHDLLEIDVAATF